MDILSDIKEALMQSQRAYNEYLKEEERLETKRANVIASIEHLTQLMKAKREINQIIVKQYWEEKECLMELSGKALQKSIDLADVELADIHMRVIKMLYSQNPFDKMRNMF